MARSKENAKQGRAMSLQREAEDYLEEVALWCLTSSSFTTCFTLGTCSASFWTDERRAWEGTVPFKETTPLETSYRTSSFNLCCTSIASRFLSMPESRSESTFFAVPSPPFGRTPISFDTTSLPAMDLAIDSARALSSSVLTLPLRVTTPLSRS